MLALLFSYKRLQCNVVFCKRAIVQSQSIKMYQLIKDNSDTGALTNQCMICNSIIHSTYTVCLVVRTFLQEFSRGWYWIQGGVDRRSAHGGSAKEMGKLRTNIIPCTNYLLQNIHTLKSHGERRNNLTKFMDGHEIHNTAPATVLTDILSTKHTVWSLFLRTVWNPHNSQYSNGKLRCALRTGLYCARALCLIGPNC